MSREYVAEYLRGPVYREGHIPVETAMCYISRAVVFFPSMRLAFTQTFVSHMQQVMLFIFNGTHCVPDTLCGRHCGIAIFTHQVFLF
jgi:hypothetical protein